MGCSEGKMLTPDTNRNYKIKCESGFLTYNIYSAHMLENFDLVNLSFEPEFENSNEDNTVKYSKTFKLINLDDKYYKIVTKQENFLLASKWGGLQRSRNGHFFKDEEAVKGDQFGNVESIQFCFEELGDVGSGFFKIKTKNGLVLDFKSRSYEKDDNQDGNKNRKFEFVIE